MSDDDRWPWYDPVTTPPPTGVEVIVLMRGGARRFGIRIDGKWKIDGRLMPPSVVTVWTIAPPLPLEV